MHSDCMTCALVVAVTTCLVSGTSVSGCSYQQDSTTAYFFDEPVGMAITKTEIGGSLKAVAAQ